MGRFTEAAAALEKAAIAGMLPGADGHTEMLYHEVRALRMAAQHLRLVDSKAGEADMPVFTLLAKDRLSSPAIWEYYQQCVDLGLTDQAKEVLEALKEWEDWQLVNRNRIVVPDHKHMPIALAGGPTRLGSRDAVPKVAAWEIGEGSAGVADRADDKWDPIDPAGSASAVDIRPDPGTGQRYLST